MNNLPEKQGRQQSPQFRAPKGKKLTSRERREKREILVQIYGSQCFYCRRQLNLSEITLDHLVPLSEGGSNHLANLRIACYQCNYGRHHKPSTRFPKGFPLPRFFFGQCVRYHSLDGSVRGNLVISTYEGFITGMTYQHYDEPPQWRYQLSNIHEGDGFHIVTEQAPESTLVPLNRKPLAPEKLQLISNRDSEPQQPITTTEICGEEISFSLRGYTCIIRRVDDGWLSLIDKRGIGNPVLICNASPTLVEAMNKALKQALRMAPSSAMGSLLYDLYKWGDLSHPEYQRLHYSFHGGLKY